MSKKNKWDDAKSQLEKNSYEPNQAMKEGSLVISEANNMNNIKNNNLEDNAQKRDKIDESYYRSSKKKEMERDIKGKQPKGSSPKRTLNENK